MRFALVFNHKSLQPDVALWQKCELVEQITYRHRAPQVSSLPALALVFLHLSYSSTSNYFFVFSSSKLIAFFSVLLTILGFVLSLIVLKILCLYARMMFIPFNLVIHLFVCSIKSFPICSLVFPLSMLLLQFHHCIVSILERI